MSPTPTLNIYLFEGPIYLTKQVERKHNAKTTKKVLHTLLQDW
jgi:hypothetical protein